MKVRLVLIASVCVVLACVSSLQATVIIDTVPVGNPGNADDTHGDGYGGVDYAYNIGKFEVTAPGRSVHRVPQRRGGHGQLRAV